MRIKETLKEGESSTVEFKSWKKTANMKERIKLAVDELVAFANSKGGTVYFGVEDDGTVTGCDKYDTQKIIESDFFVSSFLSSGTRKKNSKARCESF